MVKRIKEPVFQLTTGAVEAYPAVLRKMSRPVVYDRDPAFQNFYAEVIAKAQRALGISARPVIMQGDPVLALEAAAASLIARKDVVVGLVSGVYGRGFGVWARRYCKELIEIEVPYNEVIDPAAVEATLRARPDIQIVTACHHDTPSGTLNPIEEIGRIVAKHGKHFIVDAVSSFGGMDVSPDSCHADIFVTGPSKCLGCPPGLSLVGVSERAWEKMRANPDAPRASVLSILDWGDAGQGDRPFPVTPSISDIYGLDAALDLYLSEGPENVWARHALTAKACRAGVRAMGLELWPIREEIASPTTTAVKLPNGVEDGTLRSAIRSRYGVVLSSGRGETLGKVIRIGHMGPAAQPLYAIVALAALGGGLNAVGRPTDVGAGVSAAMAVIDRAA